MGALPQRVPSISDSLRGPGSCYAGQRCLRGTGWRPVRLGDLKPYFLSCLSFGCFPRSTGLQLHTPPADTVSTTSKPEHDLERPAMGSWPPEHCQKAFPWTWESKILCRDIPKKCATLLDMLFLTQQSIIFLPLKAIKIT